jgi:arginyl-tRNA--protein-N-Asp/Glu arginylyltransferase
MWRKPINEYFMHHHVAPQAMDRLWAEGWRHFGTHFFRYSHLPKGREVYHVLPLRIVLTELSLSRSQRRTIKKNDDIEIRVLPAFVNNEVTALFDRHKQRFEDNVPDSLDIFVSEDPAYIPCDCRALCLYLSGELIGISYLDVGERATSSVYQCFEPALAKRSLGIYMMLEAIRWSIAHGKTLYYPGYAYHEPSHYDYKKAFTGLEGFDWNGEWKPYSGV